MQDITIEVNERKRLAAAIGAVICMHRGNAEEVLRSELPKVLEGVQDEQFGEALALSWQVPVCWTHAGVAAQTKMQRYLESDGLKDKELLRAIARGLLIPALEDIAVSRAKALSESDLGRLLSNSRLLPKLKSLIPWILTGLKTEVKSFRGAESYFENLIVPLAPVITVEEVHSIVEATKDNGQILSAGGIPPLLAKLFTDTERLRTETKAIWSDFASWLVSEDAAQRVGTKYEPLYSTLSGAGIAVPEGS